MRLAHCAKSVLPLMSPSGPRCGRYAIHGFAGHRPSTVRADHLCRWLDLRESLLSLRG